MKPANDATRTQRLWLLTAAIGIALTFGLIGLVIARDHVDAFVLAFGFATFPGWLWLWPMQPILPDILGAIGPPTLVGWFVYAGLGLAVIVSSSRQWERLFVLFLLLLSANVAGCWYASFVYYK